VKRRPDPARHGCPQRERGAQSLPRYHAATMAHAPVGNAGLPQCAPPSRAKSQEGEMNREVDVELIWCAARRRRTVPRPSPLRTNARHDAACLPRRRIQRREAALFRVLSWRYCRPAPTVLYSKIAGANEKRPGATEGDFNRENIHTEISQAAARGARRRLARLPQRTGVALVQWCCLSPSASLFR